ncbi:hypothetical protein C5Y96_05815 [Blastopirellula marina]|uniref:Uncharacterized protein n=1 Tax=Blastopirellula marina TaxID=124 RepID=A0A2S8G4Z4_9BACT|nr:MULTISPECIES: hypothetical protein [Pirellulaceae]PQO39370.1 hypothetical protein C5Y96_05815 [Blastopirellula marina]RCS55678.1 hypothetical protein DTL36_05825 [Bremerella cremea]
MTEQGSFQPLWKAADDEQQAKDRLHARQLACLEKALDLSGIHRSSSAYRLARLVFHVTKNTGGVLSWTAERIAADQAMRLANGSEISPRSVQRAAAQLRRAGIIQQATNSEAGRGVSFAARSIDWRHVAAIAEGEQAVTARATDSATARAIDRAIDRATASATDRATAYANGGSLLLPLNQEPKTPITTWKTARGKVCKWVSDWVPPLKHCQVVGVSPDYVCQVVDLFEQAGGLWPPGGLRWRLLRAAPEIEPDRLDAWPPIAEPTGEERRACEMLANVRQWCQDKPNADPPEVIFRRAANDKGLGELVDRALFRERLADMAQV